MADTALNPLRIAKCFRPECKESPEAICRHCGQEYCDKHRSRYAQNLCCECIADNVSLETKPLIDDEGVEHKGRVIRLIGEGWPSALDMIHKMTLEELEAKIEDWQKLLQRAMITGEFWRISIAAAHFEKEERLHNKKRRREDRAEALKQGTVSLSGKKVRMGAKPESVAQKLAKQLNITLEQAEAIIKMTGVKHGT